MPRLDEKAESSVLFVEESQTFIRGSSSADVWRMNAKMKRKERS